MGASATTIYLKSHILKVWILSLTIENPRYISDPLGVCAFVLCWLFVRFSGAKGLGLDLDLVAEQKKGQDLRANSLHSGLHGDLRGRRKERRRGNKKKIASSKEGALFSRHRIRNDPNTKMNWVLLLLAGAAAMAAVASAAFQTGPCANTPACKCKWSEGKRMADCRNAGFNAVPETLSDDIQVQFSALIELFGFSPL